MPEPLKLPLTLPLGKMSTFGGVFDKGMRKGEGTGIYEHKEADLRPDLFLPRSHDPRDGVSQRLRTTEAIYFAFRYPKKWNVLYRKELQAISWILENPRNHLCVSGSLVDWGPNEGTGRYYDLSELAEKLLKVKTNDTIQAYRMIL